MFVKKSKESSVTSVTKKPNKKINNILSWSRAFQVYASIYCIKYPEESAGMFQYMSLIQTLSKQSPNRQLYDVKFRKLRKHRPLPWAKLHLQAHVYSSLATPQNPNGLNNSGSFRSNKQNFRSQSQTPNRIFRKGYCWEFQRLGKCTKNPCNRIHKCSICEGPHAGTSCPRTPRSTPPLVTKQTTDNLKHQVVLPTPIKVTILDLYLEGYGPDERKFLIAGFSRGFSLGTVGEVPPTLSKIMFLSLQFTPSLFKQSCLKKSV